MVLGRFFKSLITDYIGPVVRNTHNSFVGLIGRVVGNRSF
jgi:RNase P/RNase MRP subunit p29